MNSKSRRGQISLIMIVVIVVVGLVCITAFVMRRGSGTADGGGQADAFAVKRGGFDITVPAAGELAALSQVEIRNNLDGKAIITEIVSEGKFVNAGEIVLRLNDEDLRNKLKDAQDAVNNAESAHTTAEANLAIKIKTGESDMAKADLAIMLADLALKAWQEGEDVSKRQALSLAVETAQKAFDRLEDRFKESAGLLEQKFIALDEFKKDEIALLQAKAKLEQAKLDVVVYEKYQFMEAKAKKESDLEQAKAERDRVLQRSDAGVRSAQSEVDSKKYALESAKLKAADYARQLALCVVAAPTSGLVVYYSSTQQGGMGRDQGAPPQVGTELTRNQTVIILPDTSRMVAAVKVGEALSGQIKSGQRASIISDALPDRPLSGEVLSVGVLAESGGWRDPNRRDYTVRIALTEGNDLGLKPSMRCKAEIHVGRVENSLYIPIQAVFRTGPLAYAYVPQDGGYAQRKISVGRSSELYIEIADGLTQDDRVLLREPETEEIVARLEAPKLPDKAPDMMASPNKPAGMPGMGGPAGGGDPTAADPTRAIAAGGPDARPDGGPGEGNPGSGKGRSGRNGGGGRRPAGPNNPTGGNPTGEHPPTPNPDAPADTDKPATPSDPAPTAPAQPASAAPATPAKNAHGT